MKRILLSILIFFPVTSFGQIVINNGLDWQQLIPLITGGKSIEVSNVQIQGPDSAFGQYQAFGNEHDLSYGIVMTTGKATGINGPLGPNNSTNAGMDNGSSGHPLANLISGGVNSFNASVIEFDFSSPVNDTLQLSYLFGSEEYKEYVGSEFNDAFGFFVTSGPGITTPINIALVPGTTVPIAINNVNHITNSSYFTDNEIISGSHLQYDGFVRLKTEKFPIQPGQTYHILLLVSDVTDPIYDSGVFLELQNGSQNLCGQILYEDLPAGPGYVELIGYKVNEADAYVIDTAIVDVSGNFNFPDINYGGYILRSVLDPTTYPLAYPVYLDSVVVWNMADIQYLPTLDTTCSILNHRELPLGTGPGTINGTIVNDNLVKHIGLITGKSETYVFAYDENDVLRGASKMDKNGGYELKGLEDGIYTLYVDYLGYSMMDTNRITISAGNYNRTANYLTKNEERQIVRLLENLTTNNQLSAIPYPNPSNGDFTLFINAPEFMRELNVEVYDVRGRVIYHQNLQNVSEGQSFYRFDLAESVPSGGIYVVKLQNEKTKSIFKILVGE